MVIPDSVVNAYRASVADLIHLVKLNTAGIHEQDLSSINAAIRSLEEKHLAFDYIATYASTRTHSLLDNAVKRGPFKVEYDAATRQVTCVHQCTPEEAELITRDTLPLTVGYRATGSPNE